MAIQTINKERDMKEQEACKDIQKEKAQAIIRVLHDWMNDESGYDEANWPRLKKALEENHDSDRKLFPN